MEKQQVYPVPLAPMRMRFCLPMKQKSYPVPVGSLQTANQRFFQIAFGVLILEVEKFENERILDFFFGKDSVFGPRPTGPGSAWQPCFSKEPCARKTGN